MDFVNFKKQKEKLYFYTEKPDIYCVADLNKGTVYDSLLDETFYDFTVLQKYIHIDCDADDYQDYHKDLLSQIKGVILFRYSPWWCRREESILASLRRLESAISICYENNLECYLNSRIEAHIPAGFINWLKEKRKIFSYENMINFLLEKQIKESFSIEWYPYIALILKSLIMSSTNIINFLKTECGKTYLKIVKKTLINSFCCYRSVVPDYDTFCFLMENPEEGLKLLDTNRSIERNLEIIREYRNKKEEELFIKNLTKINFIDQFTKGNYIVVVPQKLDDLIDEGKQQNNCVGSFYNDNIICGRDYIYFIRRKDNPKKSVATARYNVNSGKTIELKEKNNKEAHEQFWTFTKEIDELINNYLK